MFNSTALEVGLGLIFVYLTAALACTAASELIAAILRSRARTLRDGLKELLMDDDWFKKVMDHPLIAGLYHAPPKRGGKANRIRDWIARIFRRESAEGPSYISSAVFARALTDAVMNHAKEKKVDLNVDGGQEVRGAFSLKQFEAALKALPERNARTALHELQDALQALADEAKNDIRDLATQATKVQDQVELWFNEAMDRVSGWYKRRVQLFIFVTALVITGFLNIDTIGIARALSRSPELRASVVKAAEQAATQAAPTTRQAKDSQEPATPEEIRKNYELFKQRLAEMQTMDIPLGWKARPCDEEEKADPPKVEDPMEMRYPPKQLGGWVQKIAGLLLTALAVSLGAPFWFDVLGKVISIRSAGKAPEEKPKPPKVEPKAKGPTDTPPPAAAAAAGAGVK